MRTVPPHHSLPTKKEVGIQAYDPVAPTYIAQSRYRRSTTPVYESDSGSDACMDSCDDHEEVKPTLRGKSIRTRDQETYGRRWEVDEDFSDDGGPRSRRYGSGTHRSKVLFLP